MNPDTNKSIGAALGAIPTGVFLLTAQHEDRRQGMLASWVQQTCFQPPMVCVAVAKGRPIMPLISESRRFVLCQLDTEDRVIQRKFRNADHEDAPFLGFELVAGVFNNVPILKQCHAWLECELSCHMDVEGDHDLFVGQVHGGGRNPGSPLIRIREDGFTY